MLQPFLFRICATAERSVVKRPTELKGAVAGFRAELDSGHG
jgi:hypothetical protein